MLDQRIVLTGMGHFHPPHPIPNEFFDSLGIASAAQWISERTGINNRFSVLPPAELRALGSEEGSYCKRQQQGDLPSMASMSCAPWQMALTRAGLGEDFQPDVLISGSSVPDMDIPANAALIAKHLQLLRPLVFDVNSACSSFVTNLQVAASLLQTTVYKSVAIFNIERYTLRLNYSDRSSCVLFGDGASCALLQKSPRGAVELQGLELLDCQLRSDPQGADLVHIPVMGHFSQQGARVQKFAITKTCEISNELLQAHQLTAGELSYFVAHQANLRMLESAAERLGFTRAQHLFNVDHYGNQGAAGAPAVLSQNWERFKEGERVLVAVVGSGLTWGGALLQFCGLPILL